MVSTICEAILINMQYNFYRIYYKKHDTGASYFYFTSEYLIPERDIKVEIFFKKSLKTYEVSKFWFHDTSYIIRAVTDKEEKKVYS